VLRFLAREITAQVDVHRVDTFRGELEAAGLSPRSVNMILDLLAQVLDDAVEYGSLDANPARGKRRRLKVPRSSRSFLEPDMVVDMLDVAGEWERGLPEHQRYGRREFLATLMIAGPRISELIDSPLGRLDMHSGQLVLGKKTEAGIDRTLELSASCSTSYERTWRRSRRISATNMAPPSPSSTPAPAGRLNPSNVRKADRGALCRAGHTGLAARGARAVPDRRDRRADAPGPGGSATRPRRARRLDPRPEAAAAPLGRGSPAVLRLPGRAPADGELPGRAGPDRRGCVRESVSDRQAGRGGVRRGR
jgi:integrase